MPTHDIIDNRSKKLVDHLNQILGTSERRNQQESGPLLILILNALLPADQDGKWKPARVSEGNVRDETDEDLAE